MRLIDVDARIEEIKKANCTGCNNYNGIRCRACWVDDTIGLFDDAPAVDAVEVVRCKECAVPHNKWTGCPKLNGLVPPPDFYCAYGERKDNG